MYTTILTFECTFLHCWRRSHLFFLSDSWFAWCAGGRRPSVLGVLTPWNIPCHHSTRSPCVSLVTVLPVLIGRALCMPSAAAGRKTKGV